MNMNLMFTCILMGAGVAALAPSLGCASTKDDAPSEISESDAKQKALAYVPGTAGAVERVETAEEHRWAVTVSMAGGAEAVVELERADGRLDEIAAEKGPFDYDLPAAGPGLATYAKARSAALATKPGQIEAWELNLVKNIWEIYVRNADSQLWEIKMNAATLVVTSTEEKAQRD